MTLAIDGASPVVVSGTTSRTTASFTRPAGGYLVAMVGAASDAAPVVSGGSLTWTRRVQRNSGGALYAEIWTAPVTGSGAMTVTVTITGTFSGVGLKLDAVTGQHASPIGTTGSGVSATNNLTAAAYNSTADNSRGFFVALEANGLGAPTSTDTGFGWHVVGSFVNYSGIAARKATNTATSGTAVSFNADASGSSAPDWYWAALEILAGSVTTEITTETVAVLTALPTPTVAVNSSPVPATITAVTTAPTPAVQAGSNVHPVTITAVTAMSTPSVTTENTQLVALDTIAVTAAMPGPAVAIDADATLATIDAIIAMYSPTVQVHADVTLSPIAVRVAMPTPIIGVPVLPGDRISRPGQIEWNGTLLGSLTPYSWQELQGWVSSAPWISGNVDRPDASGSYPGQPYTAERVINWSTLLKAPRTQIGQIVHDLVMATGPAQTEAEGYLVVWDFDDTQPWLVRAHLSNREPGPINRQARLGLMRGALQWTASDPRRYDPVRTSLTIAKGVETSILNNGNDSTPGELRFPGPASGIQVENITTNLVIAFSTVVGSGETLVVDVKEGNAFIGDENHSNDLIQGSTSVQAFVFDPGENELLYTTASGGTAGMQTFWRHAVS